MSRASLLLSAAILLPLGSALAQQPDPLVTEIDRRAKEVAAQVIDWRHDIHQHPELSFAETRTAALVAAHLKWLGRRAPGRHGRPPGR
jgi:hypothetical protein